MLVRPVACVELWCVCLWLCCFVVTACVVSSVHVVLVVVDGVLVVLILCCSIVGAVCWLLCLGCIGCGQARGVDCVDRCAVVYMWLSCVIGVVIACVVTIVWLVSCVCYCS